MSTENTTRKATVTDWLALWFFLVGFWPFMDPGHSGHSFTSKLDLLTHLAAAIILVFRWRIVRR